MDLEDLVGRSEIPEEFRKPIELLINLLNNSPDHIYFKDKDSRFIAMSKAQAERFGLKNPSEAAGKTDFDYFSKEHAEQAFRDEKDIMDTGRTITKEEKETWADGSETWVSTTKSPLYDKNGKIIGTFGISRDITKPKKDEEEKAVLQEQLYHAQKMESIGHLVAKISHDLNNHLTPLLAYIPLAIDEAESTRTLSSSLIEGLRGCNLALEKARNLSQKLTDYSKKEVYLLMPLDINLLIKSSYPELVPLFDSKDHSLELELKSTYLINADSSQFNRILPNLVSNSRDAMSEKGKVTISTNDLDATATIIGRYEQIRRGSYVVLSVSDTGTGIKDDVLDQMFLPLFTTKGSKGTGWGLANVWSIVKGHRGYIDVLTELGKGTTFSLYFPAKKN